MQMQTKKRTREHLSIYGCRLRKQEPCSDLDVFRVELDELTRVGGGEDCGAAEVAAGLHGVLLVVGVEGVGRVVADGVRAKAAPAPLDGGAVRAALAARVVQRHLQHRRARAGARHAPAPAAGAGGQRQRRRRRRRGGQRHRRVTSRSSLFVAPAPRSLPPPAARARVSVEQTIIGEEEYALSAETAEHATTHRGSGSCRTGGRGGEEEGTPSHGLAAEAEPCQACELWASGSQRSSSRHRQAGAVLIQERVRVKRMLSSVTRTNGITSLAAGE
jgi:hypothetical protein